jgi:cytochrome b561
MKSDGPHHVEDQPGNDWYLALRVSIGLIAAALIVLRLAWHTIHRPPDFPSTMPAWKASAVTAHAQ